MQPPELPPDETERMSALVACSVLDTEPELRFDRITEICRRQFDVPIAVVSLVDKDRQWFKSVLGLPVRETPRSISFCGHTILTPQLMVVEDALADERFHDNPLVVDEPRIRFYAGAPLQVGGRRVGTLCVIDRKPRTFADDERRLLGDLAAVVADELVLRIVGSHFREQSEELERRSDDLEQFSRVLAHDLATPLRHIRMLVDGLAGGNSLVSVEESYARIARATRTAAELLEGLREHFVADAGGMRHPDALRSAVTAALQLHREDLEACGATVAVDDLPEVPGSVAVLTSVLQNLIGNAVKYRSDRPLALSVTATSQDDGVCVRVRDNGIGVPAEQRERVFELLFRLHGQDERPGSGIGLASSRKLVEGLGGRIWLDENEHGGVDAMFTLPAKHVGELVATCVRDRLPRG